MLSDFLDRVIGFALPNGIPEGLSLVNMFSNLPDLKSTLESSQYAGGSLSHFSEYINNQSRHEAVTRQFKDLVAIAKVGC